MPTRALSQLEQCSKHIPQRMCVACRCTAAKQTLVRLVRIADGRISIDLQGTFNARGAYLCRNAACWETALKRRSLERSLRLEVLHPDDRVALKQFVQRLKQECGEMRPLDPTL